jgi:hypothetical protein
MREGTMSRFGKLRLPRVPLETVMALAALLAHAPLAGQTSDAAGALRRSLVTPSAGAPIRSGIPSLFLSGSSGESEVSVEGGFRVMQDPTFGNIFGTLGLTTPLSEDEPTVLADLNGLTGGTRLSFSLTGLRWPWAGGDVTNEDWCKAKQGAGRVKADYDCDAFDLTELVEQDEALEREYYREVDTAIPVLYELSASVMPEEMSYLDATTLEPGTMDGTSGSLGASIGRFFGSQLLAVGYRHEVAFVQAPATQVCTPLEVEGALRCRNARLGAPTRREGGVGTVQARGFFRRNLAWNPRLTYRFDDSQWGVDLPIYFVPGSAGLIGGVAPNYSEDDGWAVRVFVGKAFRTGL